MHCWTHLPLPWKLKLNLYNMSKISHSYYINSQNGCVNPKNYNFFYFIIYLEASRRAAARDVTVKPTGCEFDPHSRRWYIYLNLYFHFFALVSRLSAALSSATQHPMPPEFGRKWGTECVNTRFPLPTLLCAGYSVTF